MQGSEHDVVAYPKRGRQVFRGSTERSARSLSAGRNRIRPTDLIQDVYDRMGLSDLYTKINTSNRNLTSKSSWQEESSGGQQQQNHQQRELRGRGRGRGTSESSDAENRRARSLSRGRMAQRWPPARSGDSVQEDTTRITTTTSAKQSPVRPAHNVTNSYNSPQPTAYYKDKKGETSQDGSAAGVVLPVASVDAEEEILRVTPPSVKERINIYGASVKDNPAPRLKSSRNEANRQYAQKFAQRDHPPKVNIYEDTREKLRNTSPIIAEEKKAEEDEASNHPPPPPLRAFPSPMSEPRPRLNWVQSQDTNSSRDLIASRKSAKASGIADAFLAAINSKPVQARQNHHAIPVIEITATDDQDGNDGLSVAMSSVSGDDLLPALSPPPPIVRKPAWQERNRLPAYGKTTNNVPQQHNNQQSQRPRSCTDDTIEKMIEDRVKAHCAELESRIESQMQRFLHQMTARLDTMEAKILQALESRR